MIRDVTVKVRTDKNSYDLVLTGQQIEQTMQRRMATLAPKERILDMAEVVEDSAQLDALTQARKGAK